MSLGDVFHLDNYGANLQFLMGGTALSKILAIFALPENGV